MALDFEKLKAIGITLRSSTAIERAYDELKALPMLPVTGQKLLVIDFNSLPTSPIPFKEVLIRWLLTVNEGRLLAGEEPFFPYELVKRCPLWRLLAMPIRTLDLTQERLFNKPSFKGINDQPQSKIINERTPIKTINRGK